MRPGGEQRGQRARAHQAQRALPGQERARRHTLPPGLCLQARIVEERGRVDFGFVSSEPEFSLLTFSSNQNRFHELLPHLK